MLTRHIRESLQVTPGPFPDFWVGPGDEATENKASKKFRDSIICEGEFHFALTGLSTVC